MPGRDSSGDNPMWGSQSRWEGGDTCAGAGATELVTHRKPDQIIRYCGWGPLTARKGTKNGEETTSMNPVGLDW